MTEDTKQHDRENMSVAVTPAFEPGTDMHHPVTCAFGSFRIRRLQPEQVYTLRHSKVRDRLDEPLIQAHCLHICLVQAEGRSKLAFPGTVGRKRLMGLPEDELATLAQQALDFSQV